MILGNKTQKNIRKSHIHNFSVIIVLIYLIIIFAGSLLLSIPIARTTGQSYIDTLFTATSSVCVTGMTMGDIATTYTFFGELIILILFQIGGLGYMTLAVTMFVIMGKNVGLEEKIQLKETQGVTEYHGMKELAMNMVKYAFIAEGIGALILWVIFLFDPKVNGLKTVHYAVFHSVSAFCNCGMDIFGTTHTPECGLLPFNSNPYLLLTLAFLTIMGGFGYIAFKDLINPKRFRKRSTQTKIVFTTTLILLVMGTLFFFFAETSAMEGWSVFRRLINSFFLSASCRSAGFMNIDSNLMSITSIWFLIFLMTIGGSPSGTAGGIKTTTLAVLFASVKSALTKKEDTEIFARRIPTKYVNRAITIIFLYVTVCIISIIVLGITEKNVVTDLNTALSLQVEVFSAISTVGFSGNLHRLFSPAGKMIMIFLMFTGRVGTLTIFNMLVFSNKKIIRRYPADDITIG